MGSLDVFSTVSKMAFSLNRGARPFNQEGVPGSTGWRLLEIRYSSDIVLVPWGGGAITLGDRNQLSLNSEGQGLEIMLSAALIPSEFCEGGPLQPAPWLLGAAGASGLFRMLSIGTHFLFLYFCLSPVSLFLQGHLFQGVTVYPNDQF